MIEISKKLNVRLLGGLAIVIGLYLYSSVDNEPRDTSEQAVSKANGVIGVRDVGRGTVLVLLNEAGSVLATCHELKCGYANYRQDIGKVGVFYSIQDQVVRIDVDGVNRLDEERILHSIARKKIIAATIFVGGAAILVGSLFL